MRGSLSQRTCHLQLTEAGTLQTLHGTEELPGVHASHMEFASYSHRDAVPNSAYTTQQAFRRRSFSFLPEHECLYTMSTHHPRMPVHDVDASSTGTVSHVFLGNATVDGPACLPCEHGLGVKHH